MGLDLVALIDSGLNSCNGVSTSSHNSCRASTDFRVLRFGYSGVCNLGFECLSFTKNLFFSRRWRRSTALGHTGNTTKDTARQTFKCGSPCHTRREVSLISSALLSNILCKAFLASLRSFRQSFSPKRCYGSTSDTPCHLLFNNVLDSAFCNCTSQRFVETGCTGDKAKSAAKGNHIEVLTVVSLRFLGHELCLLFRYTGFTRTVVDGFANATLYGADTRSSTKSSGSREAQTRCSGESKRNRRAYNTRGGIKRVDDKRASRSLNFFPDTLTFCFLTDSSGGLCVLARLRRSQAHGILRHVVEELRRYVARTRHISEALGRARQTRDEVKRQVRRTCKCAAHDRDFLKEVFLLFRLWATASLLPYK